MTGSWKPATTTTRSCSSSPPPSPAIQPIIKAIQEVFARYPNKKAGVTWRTAFLAFAACKLEFTLQRAGRDKLKLELAADRRWEEGVVIGMSGEGVLPISNLTLAKVSGMGIVVSGNGGPMNYKAAANFLALGAQTVQFCTIVMKYGLGIVDELHSGLSFLMEERGFTSVKELIGSALPNPITDFSALSPTKKLPQVVAALCEHCGNCTRCPYQAITLDRRGVPIFDPGAVHRLFALRAEMFCRRHLHARRDAAGTGCLEGRLESMPNVPAHRKRNGADVGENSRGPAQPFRAHRERPDDEGRPEAGDQKLPWQTH